MFSAISCYKFHNYSNDQQENMKLTIICHLSTFLFINSPWQKGSQMTNNCEFHVLLLIFWNMKFVTGYGWKQISWSNLTLQTIASYNVSSVVLVFSMLSLGCILILLSPICSCIHFQVWFYFTWPCLFYTEGVFAWDIITFVRMRILL